MELLKLRLWQQCPKHSVVGVRLQFQGPGSRGNCCRTLKWMTVSTTHNSAPLGLKQRSRVARDSHTAAAPQSPGAAEPWNWPHPQSEEQRGPRFERCERLAEHGRALRQEGGVLSWKPADRKGGRSRLAAVPTSLAEMDERGCCKRPAAQGGSCTQATFLREGRGDGVPECAAQKREACRLYNMQGICI